MSKNNVNNEKNNQEIKQNSHLNDQTVKSRILELEDSNKKLLNEKTELEKKINEFKNNISLIELEYKNKLIKKNQEANEIINAALTKKVEELEKKYTDRINEIKKYALKDQAIELINIINQFDTAVNYPLKDEKLINYQKGFKMFLSMFNNLLHDLNITVIKPVINEEFDPNVMECFDTVNDKKIKDNVIVEIISNGYKLHDFILKPATVKVNKH